MLRSCFQPTALKGAPVYVLCVFLENCPALGYLTLGADMALRSRRMCTRIVACYRYVGPVSQETQAAIESR